MGRKKNTEAMIQFIILIGIAFLLIYAMLSKKVNYYVHPRFYIGLWISTIILILFAISLVSKIEKARHNVNIRHYMIFAIPLAAALLFPATGVNSKDMTMSDGNLSASTSENQTDENIDEEEATDTNTDSYSNDNMTENYDSTGYSEEIGASSGTTQENAENTTTEEANVEEDVFEKYSQYEVDGVLVIGDDIFADWYLDVYDHLDSFVGKKCQYLAQVYSMEDFEENQFLAGRYFMVCCAADLVGYGIVCESDIRSELKDKEWITVTGTITDYQYNGYSVPMLTDVTIAEAEAPEVEYIYYNY